MTRIEAVVTLLLNGRVIKAECCLCHDLILNRDEGGSHKEQEEKLQKALARHIRNRRPDHRDDLGER